MKDKLHRRSLGDSGFSIVESMLGTVLLASVAAGMSLSFPLMMRNRVDTEKRIQAVNVVHERLDQIQSLPYAAIFVTPASNFHVGGGCSCDGIPSYSENNFDTDPAHFGPTVTTISGIPVRLTTCVVEMTVPLDVTVPPSPVCPAPGTADTGLKAITVRGEFQAGSQKKSIVATSFVSSPEPPSAFPAGGGTISGNVTAQENPATGLSGVAVEALDSNGALVSVDWTDASGHYTLKNLGGGAFTVNLLPKSNAEVVTVPTTGLYLNEPAGGSGKDFVIQNSAMAITITGVRGTTVLASQTALASAPTLSPSGPGLLFSAIIGADRATDLSVVAAPTPYHVYCVPPGSTVLVEPSNYLLNGTSAFTPVGPVIPGNSFALVCP